MEAQESQVHSPKSCSWSIVELQFSHTFLWHQVSLDFFGIFFFNKYTTAKWAHTTTKPFFEYLNSFSASYLNLLLYGVD